MQYQVYKQQAGACNDIGEVLEPGWYWVRMDDATVPVGREDGPFLTKREANRAARAALTFHASKLVVNVYDPAQPAGSSGFRTGDWLAHYAGRAFRYYGSTPHGAALDAQEYIARKQALRALEMGQARWISHASP